MFPSTSDLLIQWVSDANSEDWSSSGLGTGAGESVRHVYLPHPSLPGNLLVLFVTWGQATPDPTCSVADDTSTSWTQVTGGPFLDATSGDHFTMFYRLNNPGGINGIDITYSGALAKFCQECYGEFWGIATASAIDGTPTGRGITSASVSPGSITTTQNGDLILTVCWNGDGSTNFGKFLSQANNDLLGVDSSRGMVAMYGLQASAGAIDPTITAPASARYRCIGVAFKTDLTKGTLPSPFETRVVRELWWSADPTLSGLFTFTQQVPCRGNLMVGNWSFDAPTALSDTKGNVFAKLKGVDGNPAAGTQTFFWSFDPITDPDGLVLRLTTPDVTQNTLVMFDIERKGGFEIDKTVTGQGQQVVGVNTDVTTTPIQPSAPGGIIISCIRIDAGTIRKNVGTGYRTAQPWAPEWDGGQNLAAEDDGTAIVIPQDVSVLTPVWQNTKSTGVNFWEDMSISFIPRRVRSPVLPAQILDGWGE